jgi:LTXXQ motif family protein
MLSSTGRNILAVIILAASVVIARAQTPSGSPGTGMPMMEGNMSQMMGQQGSAGGMPMSRGAGEMVGMVQMMRAMMAEWGPMGMMPLDNIEGRIAFLKAELAVTDAQEPQWNAFADALRAQAKTMQSKHAAMMDQRSSAWPDRLAVQELVLSDRLAALKAIEGPVKSLYATLSEQQRQKADELMANPMMGMM